MPLVLATNEATASGHSYADVTGAAYEYPCRYRSLIKTGERFVYYRGRRLRGGGTRPQGYFGVGVIGRVTGSLTNPDRLVAEILDYRPFLTEVSLKWSDGEYVEPDGAVGGRHYQVGVRRISEEVWQRLIQEGHPGQAAPAAAVHGSPETAHEIDAYAMRVAMARLRERFPRARISRMPQNNPGFDIALAGEAPIRYVEVKGTQSPSPRFFISEGERLFAMANQASYLLMVVYGIDRVSGSHRLFEHGDASIDDAFTLVAQQWIGTLRPDRLPDGSG